MKRPWRRSKRSGDRSGESAERRPREGSTRRSRERAEGRGSGTRGTRRDSEDGPKRRKRRAGRDAESGRRGKREGEGKREGKRKREGEGEGKSRRDGKSKERSRKGGARVIAAFREGGRATRSELGDTPKSIGARALAAVGAVTAALIALARTAAGILAGLFERLLGPRSTLGRRLRSALAAASEALTPARGLLIAAIGCAVLLGLSQFADYRGIAIGVDNYDPEVSAVAPAPEVDRKELGTAHSYLMIPAAVIAIAILVVAARTRRWRLCRLAALIGLIAIAVGFLVDRPAGLDEGAVAGNFAGAEAQLLGGWWAQLFAGIGLIVTSLMLGAELRRGGDEPSKARARRPRRSSAGKRGKRDERTSRRSRPDAEGAGA